VTPTLAVTNKCFGAKEQDPHGGGAIKKPHARLAAVWQQKTGDINNKRLMDYMTKVLALTAALVIALPSIASATCGTQDGPGLRGPDGKCVSWERVSSVCGPDRSRCQSEQVNPLIKQLDTTPPRKLMGCAHGMRNDC
jgi:hypothetical protein